MADAQKTHYDILSVTPSSTKPEIDRAYLAKKASGQLDSAALWELERAYVTLADVNLKRKYDGELKKAAASGKQSASKPSAAKAKPQSSIRAPSLPSSPANKAPIFLAALAGGLLLVFALRVWPMVSWRFEQYPDGTQLISKSDGQPFGEVLDFDGSYKFPNGATKEAYKVQLVGETEQRWVTKHDVNLLAEPK